MTWVETTIDDNHRAKQQSYMNIVNYLFFKWEVENNDLASNLFT